MAAGYGIRKINTNWKSLYKVEINRIYNKILQGIPVDSLDLGEFQSIEKLTYLDAAALETEEITKAFYQEENAFGMMILPIYTTGRLEGFVRFDYQHPKFNVNSIFLFTQGYIGIMTVFVIAILLYLRSQLIRPFFRMIDLTYDLANGHLNRVVMIEKSKFFRKFLWGLGMLKDTLAASKERQLELEQEKKKLLLSLSHDIKTPLQSIQLYGKALEENLYPTDIQKNQAARQICQKVKEIEHYVTEITKYSQEDILDIQVNKGEFYQADLIHRILATYKEKCKNRALELQIGTYENLLLNGDLERALEVFENIFENAFKYGDGRKIEISFYEEDYCHLIRIYNTGTPVTDNEFNHIFDSFFRGTNSNGKKGSGLGLYICREIMRKMDGEIFAQKLEEGMAFVLVFR